MKTRTSISSGGLTGFLVAALALVFSGCSKTDVSGYDPNLRFLLRSDALIAKLPPAPPRDRHENGKLEESILALQNLGGRLLEPAKLDKPERTKLEKVLEEVFGTPAAPKLPKVEPELLAEGAQIYKDKCSNCHGMNGDGRGPTGAWVYPVPRDFRLAKVKFVSTPSNGIPTMNDLTTSIKLGVAGNAMPPFALAHPKSLTAVTGYTMFLTIRGRVEYDLLSAVLSEEGLAGPATQFVEASRDTWMNRFAEADQKTLNPTVPPLEAKEAGEGKYDEQVRRGFQSFTVAGCASCHRDYGRDQHWLYDEWGLAVSPANLILGKPKAGAEPLDLFRRIRCGISPAGMPAVSSSTLGDEQVWDLVLFLKALPVPRHLPTDVRAKIYP
jgi:mono/diheme cytochrome c family protein